MNFKLCDFLYGINILGIIILVIAGLVSFFLNANFPLGQHKFTNGWQFTFMSGTIPTLSMLGMAYTTIIWALILATIRKFLKNLINEQIFIKENVSLVKRASLFLVLASFEGGVVAVNGSGFINLTFILVALLVWIFAKLLERAVGIAEENEFTI